MLPAVPDGIVLPKAEGASSLKALDSWLPENMLILPIATETPAAIFSAGTYGGITDRLAGLTWGAEDLPAAIGAVTAREADGRYPDDRKSVVEGKSVSVRVDLGGLRILNKKNIR